MIRFWMEKKWVQLSTLAALLVLAVYYWGWAFDFGYKFDWSVLFTVNETYGEHYGLLMLKGVCWTVVLSLVSAFLSLGLGVMAGLGRVSVFKPVYWLSTAYVELFRNTPLLVQLLFWYFAFPQALPEAGREWIFGLGFGFQDLMPGWMAFMLPPWLKEMNFGFEFLTAVISLSTYTGSFMAEVIRAGLQSIPKGLLEAAYSSGLTYAQVLSRIILPISFRAIIPPLGSEFLNNMKNSSLAIFVGVAELTWSSQQVESMTFRGFEAATAASVLYLTLSLGISALLNTVNIRLRIGGGNRGLGERMVNGVLDPVSRTCRTATRPARRALRRASARRRQRRAMSYSPARAALNKAVALAVKSVILGIKALFVLSLAYVAYRAVMGVIGFNWDVILDNFKLMLYWRFPSDDPSDVLAGVGGLSMAVLMAVIAITCSFPLGLLAGLGRTSRNLLWKVPSVVYIEVIRGNPLIMVIFWVYFFIPVLTGAYLHVFWSATIALTVFTGAYLGEIVRAGIENLPPGQFEAAYSTGLSYCQTMRRVILPQALKQMIPPIVGQFIAIFKDTSLAYVLGVMELTNVTMVLNNRIMIYPIELYTAAAFLYFVCCYAMSGYARHLENRLSPEKARLAM
ncbi:amino acid ABC transporter permease [Desulfocurvus sp. DL9XJH121]